MGRHPWVAAADDGTRWGIQMVVGTDALPSLVESGRLVESLGYDGLFILDHPAIHADPWICLSAFAAATSKVRLGSVVNCVRYRHPGYIARIAADLDNLSHGRLVLGLGIGWLKPEFAAFDIPFDSATERYAALEEALQIIPGVWGPERFSFSGQHYRVDALQIQPPPVQTPRPPLMIGGSGEQVTLRLVAKYADACNVSNTGQTEQGNADLGGAAVVRQRLDALRRHCDELGRPYEEILRTHFTIKLVVAPTEAQATAKLERQLAGATTSPGTRRTHRSAFVVGTPDQVAAHYQSIADVGIQYFVAQVDSADHETLDLVAEKIMPRVAAG